HAAAARANPERRDRPELRDHAHAAARGGPGGLRSVPEEAGRVHQGRAEAGHGHGGGLTAPGKGPGRGSELVLQSQYVSAMRPPRRAPSPFRASGPAGAPFTPPEGRKSRYVRVEPVTKIARQPAEGTPAGSTRI